jgi:hypothetical protein
MTVGNPPAAKAATFEPDKLGLVQGKPSQRHQVRQAINPQYHPTLSVNTISHPPKRPYPAGARQAAPQQH